MTTQAPSPNPQTPAFPRLTYFTDLDVQQAHADLKAAGQPFTRANVSARAIELAQQRQMKPDPKPQPEAKAPF